MQPADGSEGSAEVTVVDGRLQVQAPGQAPVELIATSETVFEARALQGSLEFVRDDQGAVVQLVLTRGKTKMPGAPKR